MNTPAAPSMHGWSPLVYFWEGGWVGVGAGHGVVPFHSHHAVQISVGLTGCLRVCGDDGIWVESHAVAIMPNATHSFDPMGNTVAILFVDPETREGRWLRQSMRGTINTLEAHRFEQVRTPLSEFKSRRPSLDEAAVLITAAARAFCDGPPPLRRMDERIARALAWIRARDPRGLSLEAVAREAFLSPSRFAHLFTDEVGLPFRRYLLWRKLTRAIGEFGRGNNLSAAAHAAGFSDSAHLTRTFHQMFGISPTVMMGTAEFYEIAPPFEMAIPVVSAQD